MIGSGWGGGGVGKGYVDRVVAGSLTYRPQVNVAVFGDSTANISSYANFNITQINGFNIGFASERLAPWINGFSGGLIRIVANCGISGDTTAGMVARDAAGAGATRKALTDAAACGAQIVVLQAGINDIKALTSASSEATITATIAAAVANMKTLWKRSRSLGMYPVTVSLFGYSEGGQTAPNIATRQAAVATYNAAIAAAILAANGAFGSYVDVHGLVADATGAWITGYDQGDGLHPGMNACNAMYPMVAAGILRVAGVNRAPIFAYPQGTNLVANSDFSAVAAGVATGVNPYVSSGTGTLVKQVVEWRGQNWQEVVLTPTVVDGNGNVGLELDVTIANATIALNDVLGSEISVYVDDGSGGAPAVFQVMVRARANTNYADMPLFNPTVNPKVRLLAPFDMKIAPSPIVAPAAAPATLMLSVIVLTDQIVAPVRVRVALPRCVKLPTTY